MSKLITLAILVVSVMVVAASCRRQPPGPSANQTQNSSLSTEATAQEMEVTILFSGLMVLNRKSNGDFEVGILADTDVQKDHNFCVRQASASKITCRDDMKETGTRWSFAVKNATASPTPISQPHLGGDAPRPRRRPDEEAGQFDFNWIIHFDGPEFHDEPLELKANLLNPIIQLPKGQFFTRHKSYDLIRKKGGQEVPGDGAFGFVAETTGLRLTLTRGEELLLLDQKGNEILSVPYAPPHAGGSNNEIISITNVRPYPSEKSDFHLYYNLFADLKDTSKHFDFDRNKIHPCPGKMEPCYPHNMVPHDESAVHKESLLTCCSVDCTKIYLTRSGDLR